MAWWSCLQDWRLAYDYRPSPVFSYLVKKVNQRRVALNLQFVNNCSEIKLCSVSVYDDSDSDYFDWVQIITYPWINGTHLRVISVKTPSNLFSSPRH